jgi:hypothetical protein
MISRQFFTIDDVIASDFNRNAVQIRIRDGLTIDDELAGLTEGLTSLRIMIWLIFDRKFRGRRKQ